MKERIRDRVMLIRLAKMTAVIAVSLMLMTVTAYAYFSYNVISDANRIQAAMFEVDVLVQGQNENGQAVAVNPITDDNKTYTINAEVGVTYAVTVMPADNSTTKTGFVKITAADCEDVYHTQQVWVEAGEERPRAVTFQMTVSAPTVIFLQARWGTSVFYARYRDEGVDGDYYVTQGETIALTVDVPTEMIPTETSRTEVTTTTETTATTTEETTVQTTVVTETTPTTVTTEVDEDVLS